MKIKSSVAATLGGAVFAIVLTAYLVSYATTVRDPVEWKNGDLIVQNANATDVLPVFAAEGNGMTHIGLVEVTDGGAIALGLAQQSAATGMPADQLREQMAAMPIAALPQILGQSQEVMDLAQAVSTFVKSGGTLKIAASSLAGVGMLDMGNIPAIMDKAEITATIAP